MENNEDKQLQIINKIIPKIYPFQEKIIRYTGNELIINKSRQIGVSYIIGALALVRAVFMDKRELIISPSLKQSTHVMEYVYNHLNKMKETTSIEILKETTEQLSFIDGGQINSFPNSANTVRGYPADDIWIDEYAHFTNGTDKDIIEAIVPSITRGGRVYKISSPFGDQNLFYRDWQRNDIDKLLINWRECPDIKQDHLDKIRVNIGEDSYLQEYENQFLTDYENQEFPLALITGCVNHELEYQELDKNKEYLGGADIGRINDLTAFVGIEKIDGKLRLISKKTMRQTPYEQQKDYFIHLLDNYRFNKFRIDESGIGNMLAEEIYKGHKGVERVTFNNEIKQALVSNLKRLMQEGKMEYPNDPQLIDSIRSIQRQYSPSNFLKFVSIRNDEIGHADLFWALALAVKDESIKRNPVMGVAFDWT